MSAPRVKGWCPGAHRPMPSGDGLVVRVRPFRGELSTDQALALCDLAERFGSGMLDLTSRANLQIRGVAEVDHVALLEVLDSVGLIDKDPAVEAIRNILMPPTWAQGDLTDRLYERLLETLPMLPDLPQKVGFALDTAAAGCLTDGSADFRFELDAEGRLILRADGCAMGLAITEASAMQALHEMVAWFVDTGGAHAGRMARHLRTTQLPEAWQQRAPRVAIGDTPLGPVGSDTYLGAPFGRMRAKDLRQVLYAPGVKAIRLMLHRTLRVQGARLAEARGFETRPSRLMEVHACPGAPYCPQASVETTELARALARYTHKSLHVSGCVKGCAFPRQAEITLVGRDGLFDLVTQGLPWDDARQIGLSPDEVRDKVGRV